MGKTIFLLSYLGKTISSLIFCGVFSIFYEKNCISSVLSMRKTMSSLGKSIFSLSSVGKTAFHSIFSDESANQEWDKEEQNAKTYERDDNY